MKTLLDYALYYAKELGWHVFPLSPMSKVPLAGSRGKDDATTDEEQIRKWWSDNPNSNIGIATGEKSGIVVMDIDPRNGGDDTLHELERKYGELPHTVQFLTGGGGRHIVFKHPGWKVSSKPIFEGIDSKGDGGYILAPASIHPSGNPYVEDLLHSIEDTPIADMPEWWAEKVKEPPKREGVKVPVKKPFPKEKYLMGDLITEGGRDNEMHRIASSMRTYGLEQDEICATLEEVNELRCDPPLNLKDIERISKSAAKYEPGVTKLHPEQEELCAPIEGLTRPEDYQISDHGIYHTTYQQENPVTKKIFPIPVCITRRLKNYDTQDEKIEIAFKVQEEWSYILVQRSIAFNTSKIIDLADKGLPISSSNSKAFVKFLTDFISCNLDLKIDTSVSRLGWIGANKFVPGHAENVEIDAIDNLVRGYRTEGTIEEWIEQVKPVLQYDTARFMLASSFASPLLKMLGGRSFVIYVYGPSRGGKTAATKVALSVWGNPEETLVSFNATQNSIEKRAGFHQNVPIGIDERQVVKDQGFVEQLIYMLANGQSKGRAKKDGGLQDQITWRTITIATGEDSLTNDSTRGGVISRVIELYDRPIPDEKLASKMHEEGAFGVAGPEFIKRILQEDGLKEELTKAKEILTKACGDNINSHISSVALIVLADFYMNLFFFNKEDHESSINLGKKILAMLQEQDEIDEGKRAYEELMSWYSVNQNAFSKDGTQREIFGFTDDTHIYIYPTIFTRVMKDLGFNAMRTKRSWAEKKIMKTEIVKGKTRLSCKATDPFTSKQTRVVAIEKE